MFLSTSRIGNKQIFASNFICKNYFWIKISFELFLQIVQIVNRLEKVFNFRLVINQKISSRNNQWYSFRFYLCSQNMDYSIWIKTVLCLASKFSENSQKNFQIDTDRMALLIISRSASIKFHLNDQSRSLNNALRNKKAFSESSISPSGWKNPSWPANKLIPLCLHVVTIPIVSNYKSHHE